MSKPINKNDIEKYFDRRIGIEGSDFNLSSQENLTALEKESFGESSAIASSAAIEVAVEGWGDVIEKGVYYVALKKFEFTKSIYGKERDLEGSLNFSIGDQATTLSWATYSNKKLKNPKKFVDHVLFLGDFGENRHINANIKLIEVDKAFFDKFRIKAKKFMDLVSSLGVFGGATAIVAINAIDKIATATLNIIGKFVQDDTEMVFTGDLLERLKGNDMGKVKEGTIVISRKYLGVEHFKIELEVKKLTTEKSVFYEERAPREAKLRQELYTAAGIPHSEAKVQAYSELGDDDQVNVLQVFEYTKKKKIRKVRVYLHSIIIGNLDGDVEWSEGDALNMEVSVGSGGPQFQFSESRSNGVRLNEAFKIDKSFLYEGDWNGYIPIAMNIYMQDTDRSKELQEAFGDISTIIQSGMELGNTSATEIKSVTGKFSRVSKAMLSLESLVSELDRKKKTVGIISGLILKGEEGEEQGPIQAHSFGDDGGEKLFTFSLKTKTGGAAEVKVIVEVEKKPVV